jgi:hypothetical protein
VAGGRWTEILSGGGGRWSVDREFVWWRWSVVGGQRICLVVGGQRFCLVAVVGGQRFKLSASLSTAKRRNTDFTCNLSVFNECLFIPYVSKKKIEVTMKSCYEKKQSHAVMCKQIKL